eukprot:1488274-Rhodomonas_salina.1
MEMPLHVSTSTQLGEAADSVIVLHWINQVPPNLCPQACGFLLDQISSQAVKGWTAHVVRSQVPALIMISRHRAGSGLHVEACTHIRNAGKPGEA